MTRMLINLEMYMSSCIAADASLSPARPAWRAVYALALGVFGLIVAEFLPASLLTPMASSLGVSEGMAGQAVTATALVALVTGLLIATATRNIDRRWVLMFFSVLQIVSSLMVALPIRWRFSCSVVCCWGSPSAASGRCPPPRRCVWCRRPMCQAGDHLFQRCLSPRWWPRRSAATSGS